MGLVPALSVMVNKCNLCIQINWAAAFCLLEIKARKETYKEFIHTDLLSAVRLIDTRIFFAVIHICNIEQFENKVTYLLTSAVNSGKNAHMNYMLHNYKSQMYVH